MTATTKQCKTCPWRVGTKPERDIPNGYSVELHEGLRGTCATGPELRGGPLRAMACHYSPVGDERPCAGWLENQIGPGNNIAVRLAVMLGRMAPPETDGPQHATFEDTLPKTAHQRGSRR